MTKKIRALLVAALALVAFGALASSASALNANPAGAITMTSLGDITFDGIIDIDCAVTLTGFLDDEFANTEGTAIGTIEGATVASCDGAGEAEAVVGPDTVDRWIKKLVSAWQGVSNAIVKKYEEFKIWIKNIPFIGDCLYQGEPQFTIGTDSDGTTGLVTSSQTAVPFAEGEDSCPSSVRMVGTFRVTTQELDL